MQNYGGNIVNALDLNTTKRFVFADSTQYHYEVRQLQAGDKIEPLNLKSYTIFVLRLEPDSAFDRTNLTGDIQLGDAIQIEATDLQITLRTGHAAVLISGTQSTQQLNSHNLTGVRHIKAADLKKVTKPWGHELWVNGEHPGYAFKQIFVKASYKTSLQYHHFKNETNVLVQGTARLHYKKNPSAANDTVTPADIDVVDLKPTSVIGVNPPVLHRLEAITDILLYETSTPHLDDVVRVLDDTKRPDGRISAEHRG